jgi:hypothetical protein
VAAKPNECLFFAMLQLQDTCILIAACDGLGVWQPHLKQHPATCLPCLLLFVKVLPQHRLGPQALATIQLLARVLVAV